MMDLPEGFIVDETQGSLELPDGFVIDEDQQVEEKGFIDKASDFISGNDRATEEMESLSEIGNAPELNEMSWAAFKTSLGLLATGDTEKSKGVIKSQIPSANFREDAKGNVIVVLPSGEYALNKPGVSPQDVAKGVFDITAFTPAGRAASIPAAAAKSAATEAALQGVTQGVGGGDISPESVIGAGLIGGAGKLAEDAIGAGYRMLKGSPTDDAAGVAKFAKDQDLPLMTSDVAQPETFVGKSLQGAGEKVPLTGTGGMRADQQTARTKLVDDYAKTFGEYNPSDVMESLKRQTSKIKQAAGSSRQVIVDKVKDAELATNNAIDAIDNEVLRLGSSPSGSVRETADRATIDKLEAYKNDLLSDPTFENLEQLRTQFRTDVKGERIVMPSRSDAAINKIYAAMSKDMDDTVRYNLGPQDFRKWKNSNAVYANEANKIKNTRLKTALQKGDLTPEVVNNLLYSNKPSEVKALFSSLDSKGKDAARAGLIGKAFEKSSGSPDRFLNELNKLRSQTGITFRGDDKQYLDGLKAYLDATRQASRAEVVTPTGQQLFQVAVPAGIATDVSSTGGITTALGLGYGGLARIYESKPMRVAMMRLQGMPKGSSQFEQQLAKISTLLQVAAQVERRSEN